MRVFVVEGSEIVRNRLAFLLSEIGWVKQVNLSSGVQGTLEAILALNPDVVLMDIRLPDGNGLNLLQRMRAHGVTSKVIVMTLTPHPGYRKKAGALGALGFIDKATELGNIRSILGQIAMEPAHS
jgi:DNA-binding NarL/FixJ family response regulator